MKKSIRTLTLLLCVSWISCPVIAQDARETEISRLENLEREAVLKGDSSTLFNKLWSTDMVINTPANVVGTVAGTKAILRTGGLSYLSFERTIEKITFNGDLAIVMGGEKIKPQGKQMHAGKIGNKKVYERVETFK